VNCPVCSAPDTALFLERRGVPVHQNLVCPDAASARRIARGDLAMTVCAACGFVFNRAFDPRALSYGAAYDNTQVCSPCFDAYVDEAVEYLADECGLRGSLIVEIGCGKGHFLRKLVARDNGNRGIGFDPAYVGPSSDAGGRLVFERRFYDSTAATPEPDAVVCRHVIEHIPDPIAFVSAIRRAVERSPAARIYFETPCAEWIMRNRVIWDLFYEHCSLFTAGSLTTLFERCGFEVTSVRRVFGEQYLWLEAAPAAARAVRADDAGMARLCDAFARDEARQIAAWRERLAALRERGRIALWGAGAKGVTFADLLDRGCETIDCVVDLNPGKQGRFVPGTGHPIVDFRELNARGVRSAILMNPNYGDENRALIRDAALDVSLYSEETWCA